MFKPLTLKVVSTYKGLDLNAEGAIDELYNIQPKIISESRLTLEQFKGKYGSPDCQNIIPLVVDGNLVGVKRQHYLVLQYTGTLVTGILAYPSEADALDFFDVTE